MGILISKQLQENFQKQQQFQLEAQRIQLERQIQMQQLMQERMMAMQIAGAREKTMYFLAFFSTFGLIGSWVTYKTKNPAVIAPLFPFAFITHYFYDTAYGDKLIRNRKYAEEILANKSELLGMPNGPVTFDEIEERRAKMKDEERFTPNQLYL